MIRSTEETRKLRPNLKASNEPDRAKWVYFLGKFLQVLTFGQYFFVGLTLVLTQLILRGIICSISDLKWRRRLKKLSSQLTYITYAPGMAFNYFWARAELNIHSNDKKTFEDLKKARMFGVIVANHSFTVDYITVHTLFDQFDRLTCVKLMGKNEIKYLPIAGWSAYLTDTVFVKRDWNRDRETLKSQLNELLDYDCTFFTLYAEGTRFTSQKYRDSVEFCRSKNIEPFKHHLIPKPKGFVATLRHFIRETHSRGLEEEQPVRLFNLETLIPGGFNISDFLGGKKFAVDIMIEEIKIEPEIRKEALESTDELDCNDCPKMRELLLEIYRRKDNIVEQYKLNSNTFVLANSERGGKYPFRRNERTVLLSIPLFALTYGTLGYLALVRFADSLVFWSLLSIWPLMAGAVFTFIKSASELKKSGRV